MKTTTGLPPKKDKRKTIVSPNELLALNPHLEGVQGLDWNWLQAAVDKIVLPWCAGLDFPEGKQHAAMMHHVHVELLRGELVPQTLHHPLLPRSVTCFTCVCSCFLFLCVLLFGVWVLFGIVLVCLSSSTAASLHAEHHITQVVWP